MEMCSFSLDLQSTLILILLITVGIVEVNTEPDYFIMIKKKPT